MKEKGFMRLTTNLEVKLQRSTNRGHVKVNIISKIQQAPSSFETWDLRDAMT